MKPRDYGPFDYSPIIRRPRLDWPNGERVALWVIPNIEFFSLQERPGGYGAGGKVPDVVMWSDRDYGNRIGAAMRSSSLWPFWRWPVPCC